jgi:hypothetical protein
VIVAPHQNGVVVPALAGRQRLGQFVEALAREQAIDIDEQIRLSEPRSQAIAQPCRCRRIVVTGS